MHFIATAQVGIAWGGLFKVVWVGLIAGVGLVSLFALGVRILAARPRPGAGPLPPHRGQVDVGTAGTMASLRGLARDRATMVGERPTRQPVVIAAACFALCAAIAGYGLYLLIEK